jgi:hypothetical protein
MADLWSEIEKKFSVRKLAIEMGVAETVPHKWKKSGVPVKHHRKLSALTGLSKEELYYDLLSKVDE